MPDDSKKIFVTYRRALSTDFVHRLRDHLKAREFDVFVDVQSIPSGKYAATILHQIEARPHFLAILVPGSLQRTTSEDDWYRREIEHAIKTRRNIIPLMAKGFSFAEEHQKLRRKTLPGRLDELKQYQHLSFIYEYDEQFEANINVLVKRFLVVPEETTIVPTPREERRAVQQLLQVADAAKASPAGTDWILPPLPGLSRFMPLAAPKLVAPPNRWGLDNSKLTWTAIEGATGYLLQSAADQAFSDSKDLYDGPKTELDPAYLLFVTHSFFRVKAKAGTGMSDSPWSNVVQV